LATTFSIPASLVRSPRRWEAFVRNPAESLNRGLVFREFVDLVPVGRGVASGRTALEEYRQFLWNGNS